MISCAQLLYQTLAEASIFYIGMAKWNCSLKGKDILSVIILDKNYIICISNETRKLGISTEQAFGISYLTRSFSTINGETSLAVPWLRLYLLKVWCGCDPWSGS